MFLALTLVSTRTLINNNKQHLDFNSSARFFFLVHVHPILASSAHYRVLKYSRNISVLVVATFYKVKGGNCVSVHFIKSSCFILKCG